MDKSALVLERHPESGYVDDALLLMGRSLMHLRRYGDAASTFNQLITRFPDSDLGDDARLELVRSHRLGGNYLAAQAALGLLEADADYGDPADLLHERGLIALGRGDHAAALAALRELLREHPDFARERQIALQFADAELAAGQHDAAIELYQAYRGEADDSARDEAITLKLARALARTGREEDAIAAYDDLLEGDLADSLRARAHAERGEMHAEMEEWEEAETDYLRAAELAPGTVVASRATLGRARIEWIERDRRGPALEILLDAFLHAPGSVPGDSARRGARDLARILHFQRIAEGTEIVAGLDDPTLVRSTALYRLAEEVRDVEGDPADAAAIFDSLVERYPDSPWAPRALLASGFVLRESGAKAEGDARLRRLIAWRPDDPAADSARRALGESVPERPRGFYDEPEAFVNLARALPAVKDPMLTIVDQMDRYAARAEAAPGIDGRPAARPDAPGTPGAEAPPPPPDTGQPTGLPPGVTP